jgi:chromosome segregation ATPase
MKAKERVEKFIAEYREQLGKLETQLKEAVKRQEDIELEIQYITEKELPEAVEKRVLEGSDAEEVKIRKHLEKLKEELTRKAEEIIVLMQAIKNFKFEKGKELESLEKLFAEEKKLVSQDVYRKMMIAKRAYIDALIRESKILHDYHNTDIDLQNVMVSTGRKSHVYNYFSIESSRDFRNKYQFNNVYLPVTYEEVQKFIRGNFSKDEYEYLEKFSPKG